MNKYLLAILLSGFMAQAMIPVAYADGQMGQGLGFDAPDTYDEFGFDQDGVHRTTGTAYDENGFDVNGIHDETGTEFDPNGYTRWGNQPPGTGQFVATPNSGNAPLTVTFTHNITDDVGVPTFLIDYGDGNTGTSLTHTYSAGLYRAWLTVTDQEGLTAKGAVDIQVADASRPTCQYDESGSNITIQRDHQSNIYSTTWRLDLNSDGSNIYKSTYNSGPSGSLSYNGWNYTKGLYKRGYGDDESPPYITFQVYAICSTQQ